MRLNWYKIRIREILDPDWSEWFDGVDIRRDEKGVTVIEGYIADQAALHGLLAKVRDLNLTLLSVNSSDLSTPSPTGTNQDSNERRIK